VLSELKEPKGHKDLHHKVRLGQQELKVVKDLLQQVMWEQSEIKEPKETKDLPP